ncbi:MAG TPA: gluconate 2-dehydrogenase subunit 3 family protein [Candidatus Binatia bacterium]|jgi:gluconate 2-dehydrogenase gamma chain
MESDEKSHRDAAPSRAATLTRNEKRLLAALAERIFPATDTPGAVDAGAVDYIERALAGPCAELLSSYRKGLRAVDRCARRKFGGKFARLNDADKDAVLADFAAGQTPEAKKAAEFFETVRCHVLEGIFGEPEYGGNRGLIGWRLVGFPGQQFGYPDAYIDQQVDLSPVAADRPQQEEE